MSNSIFKLSCTHPTFPQFNLTAGSWLSFTVVERAVQHLQWLIKTKATTLWHEPWLIVFLVLPAVIVAFIRLRFTAFIKSLVSLFVDKQKEFKVAEAKARGGLETFQGNNDAQICLMSSGDFYLIGSPQTLPGLMKFNNGLCFFHYTLPYPTIHILKSVCLFIEYLCCFSA